MVHQRLTQSTSAPFRARHLPVSGRLCGATTKGAAMMSRVPVAFRHTGIGFLNRPAPAGELGLPHGRLTGTSPGPRRGFHVPHGRDPAGVGALCTPGRRCSRGWLLVTSRRLPFPNGQPCPQRSIPSPGVAISRHHREFACSEVGRRRGASKEVLFRRPLPERYVRLSAHTALQRLFQGNDSESPGVGLLVAGSADDEGLAPTHGHHAYPCGFLGAAWLVQVRELADVVHLQSLG